MKEDVFVSVDLDAGGPIPGDDSKVRACAEGRAS
jgi:hypothetical protein